MSVAIQWVLANSENFMYVMVLFTFIALIYGIYYGNPCPKCRRKRALEFSGARRTSGRWWAKVEEGELKCKYCGYKEWLRVANFGVSV